MAERLAGGNLGLALIANTGATISCTRHLDRAVGSDQRRALQPGRFAGASTARCTTLARHMRLRNHPDSRLLRWGYPRPRHVCAAAHPVLAACQDRHCPMACRVRSHNGSVAGGSRASTSTRCTVDDRGMDWCRVLVHLIDLVRQSRHHDRTLAIEHFRGDRASARHGIHPGPGTRRADGLTDCPRYLFAPHAAIQMSPRSASDTQAPSPTMM